MDQAEPSDQVGETRRKLWAKKIDREELQGRIRTIRARYLLEITDELNPDGKRRYPNKEAREAALVLKLDADPDHQELQSEERRLRLEMYQLGGRVADSY